MPRRLALVLGGGGGTRLWPASRASRPKHLIPDLPHPGTTLLQATFGRVDGLVSHEDRWVITTAEQASDVARATGLPDAQILREPEGRNTGPCLALATRALLARESAEDPPTVIVLPADHHVGDVPAFRAALERACEAAEAQSTVATLGNVPTHPATGYGYVRVAPGSGPVREGLAFVEKPAAREAHAYVASGEYLWNAGVFVAPLPALGRAFERVAPELWAPLARVEQALRVGDGAAATRAAEEAYATLPKVPFDVAVMERLPAPFPVVPCAAGWSDLGSWRALAHILPREGSGPALHERGDARTVTLDCTGGLVWNEGGRVVVIGLEDVIVVHVEGDVLVCAADHAEKVRDATRRLAQGAASRKMSNRTEEPTE